MCCKTGLQYTLDPIQYILSLTAIGGMSVRLSVLWFSRQPSSRSTSHLAGVLLRSQGSAVSILKLFGWAILEKGANGNTGGHADGLFKIGTLWTGTWPVWMNWQKFYRDVTLADTEVKYLMFADVFVLFIPSKVGLQQSVGILCQFNQTWALTVNLQMVEKVDLSKSIEF